MTKKEKKQHFEKLEDFLEKQRLRIEKLKEKCNKNKESKPNPHAA